MAIAYGGEGHSAISSSASTRTTGSITIPANALVVVLMKWESAARLPWVSSGGGVSSWNYIGAANNGSYVELAYGISSGATGTLTVTFSTTRGGSGTATQWCEIGAAYFTGIDTSSPYESVTTNTGSSATQSAGPLTNTNTDALYVLGLVDFASANFSSWTFGGAAGLESMDLDSAGLGYYIAASSASRSGQATGANTSYAAALAVFQAAASSGVTGDISGSIAPLTGSAAGAVAVAGAVSGAIAPVTGSAAGTVAVAGAVAGAIAPLTGVLDAAVAVQGDVSGSIAPLTGTLEGGAAAASGDIAGAIAPLTGSLAGAVAVAGDVAGAIAALTGSAAGAVALTGSLAGAIAPLTGSAAGAVAVAGAVAGFVAPLTGTLDGSVAASLTPSPGGGTTTAGSGVARTVARGGTTTAAGGVATTERSSGIAGTEA